MRIAIITNRKIHSESEMILSAIKESLSNVKFFDFNLQDMSAVEIQSSIHRNGITNILICGKNPFEMFFDDAKFTNYLWLGLDINFGGNQFYAVIVPDPFVVIRNPEMFDYYVKAITKCCTQESTYKLENKYRIDQIGLLHQFVNEPYLSCDLETTGLNALDDKILCIGISNGKTSLILTEFGLDKYFVQVEKFLRTYRGKLVFHNTKFDLKFLKVYFKDTQFEPIQLEDTMLMSYLLNDSFSKIAGEDSGGKGSTGVGLKTLSMLYYDVRYGFDFKLFYSKYLNDLTEEQRAYKLKIIDRDKVVRETHREIYASKKWGMTWRRFMNADNIKNWDFVKYETIPNLESMVAEYRAIKAADYREFYEYLSLDCHLTYRLFGDLSNELEDNNLLSPYYNLMLPSVDMNAAMELNGMGISVERLQALSNEVLNSLAEVKSKLVGTPIAEVNLNSAKQLLPALQGLGLDIENTEKLTLVNAAKTVTDDVKEILHTILDYRKLYKLNSTYIRSILNKIRYGRVHGNFNLGTTRTGRFSSSKPNLQNIPNNIALKKCFVPREDHYFAEIDYSNLELRILAVLSGDENLKKAFNEGLDVHKWSASLLFGVPFDDVTDLQRRISKSFTFGTIYGRSPGALLDSPEAEANEALTGKRWVLSDIEELQSKFFSAFPGIQDFIEESHSLANETGQIIMTSGRVRRVSLITESNYGRAMRQAVNTRIQGMASDIMLRALNRIHAEVKDVYIVGTVHDSGIFEIPVDKIGYKVGEIRDIMEDTNYLPNWDIPLTVDVELSLDSWGDIKDK